MRIIKILIFLFLFSFTTHAFAKSNEYYQSVITNIITNCKTDQCRKDIFEQEVHIAFFNLLDAILNQVQFEISQRKKEKLWSNELKKYINKAITNEKHAHPNSLRFIFFIIQDYQVPKHDSNKIITDYFL